MGLTLTRRVSESVKIGEHIVVRVVRIEGGKVRLDIKAPDGVLILRGELAPHPAVNQITERQDDASR